MKRWLRRLAVLAVLVAIGLLLRHTVFRPDPVPVTVFVAARGRVEETVTNSKAGTIKTRHRAKMSPDIGGRVAEVAVKKGDRVAAGAVLLRIDDAEYRARVELAERALETAQENQRQACLSADLARRNYTRAADLAKTQLVSEQELDTARSQRDVAEASCQASRAQAGQLASEREVARVQLARTTLRAPFDGVVAELSAERGEWITPSPPGLPMPSVVDLIDPDSIYVSAPLDEVDLEKVRAGLPVRITMDSFHGKSYPGHLTRVAPYVQDITEQSRTFEVEATFDDAGFARTLSPGASADIEVILSAHEGVLRVPAYALIEGKRVLLLAKDCPSEGALSGAVGRIFSPASGDCLVARPVGVGLKNWEFAEITSGLAEGDRVVVSLDRAEVKEGVRARQATVTEK